MKTRKGNDMTDCTSVFYVENDTKLLWSIGPGVAYYKYQIG